MGSLERSGLSRSRARYDEHAGAIAVVDVGDGRGAADPGQRPTLAVVHQHQHAQELAGDRDRSRLARRAGVVGLTGQYRAAGVSQTAGRRRPRGRAIQPRVRSSADNDQRQRRRPTNGQPLHAPERLDEPDLNVKTQDQRVRPTRRRRPLPRHGRPGLHRPAATRQDVTLQAARASLKTAQCSLGRVARRRIRHARRGRVIVQSPPAGSHRRRGAKVKVVLAS